MNKQLLDAYFDYTSERARAGIIDHSLDVAILDGKSVEQHVVEVLRAAGRLPGDWVGGHASRRIPSREPVVPGPIKRPIISAGYARLVRADLPYAS